MRRLSLGLLIGAFIAAVSLVATTPASAADSVTVGGQSRALDGTNVARATNYLVKYTPAYGASTRTNQYGFEAEVRGGVVTKIADGVGNMAIPSDGFVLSGHGTSRTWLKTYAKVGVAVGDGSAPPPPPPPPPPPDDNSVTVGGQSRALDGTNVRRLSNYLVKYTPAYGGSTGTNAYGFEAEVRGGVVTKIADGVGNMAIPSDGFVLSGHGTSRTWLKANAKIGASVVSGSEEPPPPPPPPPGGSALLPDVGVRTLRNFTIVNTGGKKLLKFPVVTVNVGDGPLEINSARSSTSSSDWLGRQTVFNTDGSKTVLGATGAQFYWAGDGHTHWHIRDFDLYELYNPGGQQLKQGEKHGYCFEDNTSYRGWPGSSAHPNSPASPVYTPELSCGRNNPDATTILHGLSVGWADTYPATLPDQAIDITGLPDGNYTVKVTADWQNFWRETNESNQSASAVVKITGNTVQLVQANDGL